MPIFKKINKKFFKKWTPEMAYVLGFIYADGNIILTKRKTWFWSIQITDKNILEQIKKTIDSSHVISKKKKILGQKQLYRLQIGSKEMCNDLILLGLTPKKSKSLVFPEIADKYLGDFIRGYFDGDGGVWLGDTHTDRNRSTFTISTYFTSGSKFFLLSLKDKFEKVGIIGGSLVTKKKGFDLKYSIKNSLLLYKFMYNGSCSLFLTRKKEKFKKYMTLRS